MRILVSAGREWITLNTDDIRILQASNIYTIIHLVNGKKVIANSNLSGLLKKLSNDHFFRVHRSYAINIRMIKSVNKSDNFIFMEGLTEGIPLSRARKKEFLWHFQQV